MASPTRFNSFDRGTPVTPFSFGNSSNLLLDATIAILEREAKHIGNIDNRMQIVEILTNLENQENLALLFAMASIFRRSIEQHRLQSKGSDLKNRLECYSSKNKKKIEADLKEYLSVLHGLRKVEGRKRSFSATLS